MCEGNRLIDLNQMVLWWVLWWTKWWCHLPFCVGNGHAVEVSDESALSCRMACCQREDTTPHPYLWQRCPYTHSHLHFWLKHTHTQTHTHTHRERERERETQCSTLSMFKISEQICPLKPLLFEERLLFSCMNLALSQICSKHLFSLFFSKCALLITSF